MQFYLIVYIDVVDLVYMEGTINRKTSLNHLKYYGFLS